MPLTNPLLLHAHISPPPCAARAPRCTADCPNCGANSWITNQAAGDIVCTACGYVGAARIIDETGEWRAYTDKANAVDGNRVVRGAARGWTDGMWARARAGGAGLSALA